MPSIKINDIHLYYEQYGNGAPLLLISGFGADHAMWGSVVDKLSQHFKVIIFDNRGSGQSDIPNGPYTIRQMAEDAYQLCQKLGISKANILGNSMGGYIAQALAFHYPDFVEHLIISNSVMKTNRCFNLYLEAQLELIQAQAPIRSVIKASIAWAYSSTYLSIPGKIDEIMNGIANAPHPFSIAGYQGQFAALSEFDSHSWADKIRAKTLVIGADEDLIFNTASVKLLADAIPNAKYHEFKCLGHLPFIEEPDNFSELVTTFINH